MLAGALSTALLRWWQLRPVTPDPGVVLLTPLRTPEGAPGAAGRNGTKRQNSTVA